MGKSLNIGTEWYWIDPDTSALWIIVAGYLMTMPPSITNTIHSFMMASNSLPRWSTDRVCLQIIVSMVDLVSPTKRL